MDLMPVPPDTADVVRTQLGRILASRIFSQSQRLSHFLRFVVNAATESDAHTVKEYAIGVEVFDRGSDFDPRIDPIVRVQAAKLRSKLLEYYASEGAGDPVVISIPKGAYAPQFEMAKASPSRDHRASLAVLPFVNMSPEPENEYFSDGLTEELINALTAVPRLSVVARTSAFRFKGQAHDIRDIGGQLNVDTVLEGSVRKAGVQLRITAQLISVKDGYHLWSHTFKRELRDIFAVQEEIAEAVREALAPHFGSAPAQPRAKRHEPSLEAHELYLKGRYAQARLVGGSVEQAVGFFEQAIAADPHYARAHSGLADAWFFLAFWGVVHPGEAIPKAKAAAQKALELDDHLPDAHASLGVIQCGHDWDWAAGRRSIERAMELDPDSPLVHQLYAQLVLIPQGRLSEAIAALRQTIRLDPFLPNPQATLTFLLGTLGRIDEAVKQHSVNIATNPTYFFAHGTMALALEANGRVAEALEEIGKAVEGSHGFPPAVAGRARILASAGKADQAREVLGQLLQAEPDRYVAPTDVASVYSALRDRKQTLAWLRKALDGKAMHLFLLPVDPRFRWLREDPEFVAILNRMGLQPVTPA
jgi:adenylate cyclase